MSFSKKQRSKVASKKVGSRKQHIRVEPPTQAKQHMTRSRTVSTSKSKSKSKLLDLPTLPKPIVFAADAHPPPQPIEKSSSDDDDMNDEDMSDVDMSNNSNNSNKNKKQSKEVFLNHRNIRLLSSIDEIKDKKAAFQFDRGFAYAYNILHEDDEKCAKMSSVERGNLYKGLAVLYHKTGAAKIIGKELHVYCLTDGKYPDFVKDHQKWTNYTTSKRMITTEEFNRSFANMSDTIDYTVPLSGRVEREIDHNDNDKQEMEYEDNNDSDRRSRSRKRLRRRKSSKKKPNKKSKKEKKNRKTV